MENDITIGMDLGNRKHVVCALDRAGKVLFRSEVANTPEALEAFFRQHAGATVAMETGLCCRWISALSAKCGCDTVVGNARISISTTPSTTLTAMPTWHCVRFTKN